MIVWESINTRRKTSGKLTKCQHYFYCMQLASCRFAALKASSGWHWHVGPSCAPVRSGQANLLLAKRPWVAADLLANSTRWCPPLAITAWLEHRAIVLLPKLQPRRKLPKKKSMKIATRSFHLNLGTSWSSFCSVFYRHLASLTKWLHRLVVPPTVENSPLQLQATWHSGCHCRGGKHKQPWNLDQRPTLSTFHPCPDIIPRDTQRDCFKEMWQKEKG